MAAYAAITERDRRGLQSTTTCSGPSRAYYWYYVIVTLDLEVSVVAAIIVQHKNVTRAMLRNPGEVHPSYLACCRRSLTAATCSTRTTRRAALLLCLGSPSRYDWLGVFLASTLTLNCAICFYLQAPRAGYGSILATDKDQP